MIPRSRLGALLDRLPGLKDRNTVLVCANCHAIVTRAKKVMRRMFMEFLASEGMKIGDYKRLHLIEQLKVTRKFYTYLRDNWNLVLERLKTMG